MNDHGKHSVVPNLATMRRRAEAFAWKRRERVARLRRMTLAGAIAEVESLLRLDLPGRLPHRPEPPARRIVLV